MTITPIYAGLVAVLFLVLSIRVILGRRANGVSLGDGGMVAMTRRIRAQANCAEYAPLVLVLMALAELQQSPAWIINLVGLLLLGGRMLHGYALSRVDPFPMGRVAGMGLTLTALGLGAGVLLLNGVL